MFGFDLKSAKTENNREKAEGLKGKVADLYSPKKRVWPRATMTLI